MQVTTVGLDLAKNIFQVHGVSENGEVAFNQACGGRSCSRSLRNSHPVWLAWRLAAPATVGPGS